MFIHPHQSSKILHAVAIPLEACHLHLLPLLIIQLFAEKFLRARVRNPQSDRPLGPTDRRKVCVVSICHHLLHPVKRALHKSCGKPQNKA